MKKLPILLLFVLVHFSPMNAQSKVQKKAILASLDEKHSVYEEVALQIWNLAERENNLKTILWLTENIPKKE